LKAGGASLNSLAQKFGVSRDSIDRHWHRHVSPETDRSGVRSSPASIFLAICCTASQCDCSAQCRRNLSHVTTRRGRNIPICPVEVPANKFPNFHSVEVR